MFGVFSRAAFATRRLLLTGAGADRIGIIQEVSGAIFAEGGNVRESCMTKLAGDFALMMLIDIPEAHFASLQLKLFRDLSSLNLALRDVHEEQNSMKSEVYSVRLILRGPDNPGILHNLSNFLTFSGIAVSSLSTQYLPKQDGVQQLFMLKTRVRVPELIDFKALQSKIESLARQDGVEISLFKLLPSDDLD